MNTETHFDSTKEVVVPTSPEAMLGDTVSYESIANQLNFSVTVGHETPVSLSRDESRRTFHIDVPGELKTVVLQQLTEAFRNRGKRFNTFGRSDTHRERYFHAPITDGDASFLTVFAREVSPDSNIWQFSHYATPVSQNFCKKLARSLARRRLMIARQQSNRKDNDPSIYLVCADKENLFESIFRYLHGQKVIVVEE